MSTNEQARYTAEQVRGIAASVADAWTKSDPLVRARRCKQAADVLEAYAQSLTAPAGVVGDAMVERMIAEYQRLEPHDAEIAGVSSDCAGTRDFCRSLIEAALSAPEPAAPMLAKYQSCGCVICTCEDEEQCHGCGARMCGTHPGKPIPHPIYERHAPEPAAQGEAIGEIVPQYEGRTIVTLFDSDLPIGTKLYTAPPAQPAERVPEGMVLVPEEMKLEQIKAMQDAWTKREKISLPLRTTTAMALYFAALAATTAPSESEGGKGVDDKWCDCKRLRVLHLKGEFQGCHYFCKCDACGKPVIGGSYGFPDVLCEACNTTQQASR